MSCHVGGPCCGTPSTREVVSGAAPQVRRPPSAPRDRREHRELVGGPHRCSGFGRVTVAPDTTGGQNLDEGGAVSLGEIIHHAGHRVCIGGYLGGPHGLTGLGEQQHDGHAQRYRQNHPWAEPCNPITPPKRDSMQSATRPRATQSQLIRNRLVQNQVDALAHRHTACAMDQSTTGEVRNLLELRVEGALDRVDDPRMRHGEHAATWAA